MLFFTNIFRKYWDYDLHAVMLVESCSISNQWSTKIESVMKRCPIWTIDQTHVGLWFFFYLPLVEIRAFVFACNSSVIVDYDS